MDTSSGPRVLVLGATGTTGRHLLPRLRQHADVVPASRTAPDHLASGVAFSWQDESTHADLVDGVDAMYVVPPVAETDPAGAVTRLVARAVRQGTRRVVLHGAHSISREDPGLGVAQRALPDLVPEWAVLRPSWFMQNLLGEHHLARTLRSDDALVSATGDGRLPFVDVDDLAAVGAVALLGPALDREVVVTGPEALSYDDVARTVADETGRDVVHRRVSEAELADLLAPGLGPFASVLAAMDTRIADGAWNEPTDVVRRLTGRAPTSLRAFVRRHLDELGAVSR